MREKGEKYGNYKELDGELEKSTTNKSQSKTDGVI